jgi:hypothetical protein
LYKKRRVTDLKRRTLRQKRFLQRRFARQLVSGELNLSQVERLAGPQLQAVFKTVAYLEKTEGLAVPAFLAPVVIQAVAPALTGLDGVVAATQSRPRSVSRASTTTRRRETQEKGLMAVSDVGVGALAGSAETRTREGNAEGVNSPTPARRTRVVRKTPAKEEPALLVASEESGPPTPARRTRVVRKTPAKEEPTLLVASEESGSPTPARRTRATTKPKPDQDGVDAKPTPT